MAEPLPVTVLTGFLGSGKTTVLRELLKRGSKLGVIMNEVGQAGIEAPLSGKDYVELAGGCVCCMVNRDLETTLKEMCERFDLERVVIETTGLANPSQLLWNLQPQAFGDKLRVDAVVTTLDPTAPDSYASSEWQAQVQHADLLLLTKSDIADTAPASLAARTLNKRARILDAHVEDAIAAILDAPPDRAEQLSLFVPVTKHSPFDVINIVSTQAHDLPALQAYLDTLPEAVVRAKGLVWLTTGVWCRFHVVAGRKDVEFTTDKPAHAQSRVTIFGRGLDRDAIERGFYSASRSSTSIVR